MAKAPVLTPQSEDFPRWYQDVLNKAELAALVLLLLVVRISGQSRVLWAWCAVLALIVIAQGAWLIPELAARTDIILGGAEPPASYAHAIYAGLEIAKIAILLYLGGSSLAERSRKASLR